MVYLYNKIVLKHTITQVQLKNNKLDAMKVLMYDCIYIKFYNR